jgi:hypothetical protein
MILLNDGSHRYDEGRHIQYAKHETNWNMATKFGEKGATIEAVIDTHSLSQSR